MSKKSSFSKMFPPLFILGAVIGALVMAYRYIFRFVYQQRNKTTQNHQRQMKTIYADPPRMITTETQHIEDKS